MDEESSGEVGRTGTPSVNLRLAPSYATHTFGDNILGRNSSAEDMSLGVDAEMELDRADRHADRVTADARHLSVCRLTASEIEKRYLHRWTVSSCLPDGLLQECEGEVEIGYCPALGAEDEGPESAIVGFIHGGAVFLEDDA